MKKTISKKGVLLHGFGVGCIGAALYFELAAILTIIQGGYFVAFTRNRYAMIAGLVLSVFTIVYVVYLAFLLARKL